jgi:adenylyl-sulfate kinase
MKWCHGTTIWFTGLPGSGKTTLSCLLKERLEAPDRSVILLDGDILRQGLNRDLGFSPLDRMENIRRAGELAKILSDAGHVVIAAFITPLESMRQALRGMFDPGTFVEIFLDCPVDVCEARDPKKMYARARVGEIPAFTGVSAPFETPASPDLTVTTADQTIEESLTTVLTFLETHFMLQGPGKARRAPASLRSQARRVAVIGLDGVPPSLVFGDASKDLPNLRSLMEHGTWGPLRSTDPPITIPAWATITTGKDPGELGIYGFRNRSGYGYDDLMTVDASHVQAPRVWDYLEESGKSSILLGIPQTYPARPHRGITVAGFPLPDRGSAMVYPEEMSSELDRMAGGGYIPDVKGFRLLERHQLLAQIRDMVDRRFRVACDLVVSQPWDFFMMVEMGPDRMHHGFWRYCNADHRLYEPGNPFERSIPEFYQYLDSWIGSLLGRFDDNTTVMILSDHGGRTLSGGVCVNEWLIQNGLLCLKEPLDRETPLTRDMVDWHRTRVWSEGGYYARIFLNVKGREPHGTIEPDAYESFRADLIERLKAIPDETGAAMDTVVLKPADVYRECRNVPPDLIVYFDHLARRSLGTVGTGTIHRFGNDTGPDDANHAMHGIFIAARMADLRSGNRRNRCLESATCLDITPTILHEFGAAPRGDLYGKVLNVNGDRAALDTAASPARSYEPEPCVQTDSGKGFTAEEEEIVKKRLMELGYI